MERYLPLKSKSSKLADEYYHCLTQSLIGPNGPKLDECLRRARRYRAALRKQLKDLDRLGDTAHVRRERLLARSYLELVENDLQSLAGGTIPKTTRQKLPKQSN